MKRNSMLISREEIIYSLFMDIKREKKQMSVGSSTFFNPITGRMTSDITDQCEYWKCVAKFEGYLMALNWGYEEKDGWLYIRRNSNSRLIIKIKLLDRENLK